MENVIEDDLYPNSELMILFCSSLSSNVKMSCRVIS